MHFKKRFGIFLLMLSTLPIANAQENVWSGLMRTQFDSGAATLRIPCAVLKGADGNNLPDFAPAYALNLFLLNAEIDNFLCRLTDPIQAFDVIPESCLDTLTLATDGSSVTYETMSAEVDSDAMANADRFYALELQADLGGSAIDFSVVSAESRNHRRPFYNAEIFEGYPPLRPFYADYVYDDLYIDAGYSALGENLVVYEPGRIVFNCFYSDPNNLLEIVEVIGNNTRYRLKSSVGMADYGKVFSVNCTIFNLDLNRLEDTVPIFTWFIVF